MPLAPLVLKNSKQKELKLRPKSSLSKVWRGRRRLCFLFPSCTKYQNRNKEALTAIYGVLLPPPVAPEDI